MKKILSTLVSGVLLSVSLSAQAPSLYTRVNDVLCSVRSSDDRPYWVAHVADDPIGPTTAWPYWVHRMEIGDGVGKAPIPDPLCAVVPPSPAPPPAPPPLPSIDLSILVNQLTIIETKLDNLTASEAEFHQRVGIAWKKVTSFATKYLLPAITTYILGKTL